MLLKNKNANQVVSGLFVMLATFMSVSASAEKEDKRVEVGVYLESRCPDTKNFFLNQLVPTYREIGNETMKLLLVPFGHARVVSRDRMYCQHGQRECEGNKLMACMLGQGSSDAEVLEAMGCLFEWSNDPTPKDCITKHMPKTPFEKVDKCTKDKQRTYELMLEAEKMTGRINYVPHLTINGENSEEIQQEAEHHLKDLVCKTYKGTPPAACKTSHKHSAGSTPSAIPFRPFWSF